MNTGLGFNITANDREFLNALNRSGRAVNTFSNNVISEGDRIELMFNKMSRAAGMFGISFGAKELISNIVQVRNQFQQLEIAFGTMLKSTDKATKLMSELQTFAANTPFGLESASTGAKQLIAYGSKAEDVIKELTMLGDVAAGTGQQIGDLVYLYGTLRMQGRAYLMDIRQFAGRGIPIYAELAKVLGVAEGKVNELVSAGKVGFPEVEQAFKNMTTAGGMYGGLMAEQSKSIGGRWEELKDNINAAFNSIGKSSEGIIYSSIDGLNLLVANYEKLGKVLLALVATYGAYRAAVILLDVLKARDIALDYAKLVVTGKLDAAMKALNATMLTNPYVLVTALTVGLIVATWALYDATTTQEKAQKRLNEINEESKKQREELSGQTEQLIGTINAETKSKLDQIIAYKELQDLFPSYLKNMDLATFKTMKLADQQALLNNAMNENEANNLNNQLKELQSMYDRLNSSSGKGFGGLNDGVKVIDEIREKLKLTYDIDVPTYLKTQIDLLQKQRDEIQKNKQEADIRNKPEVEQIKYINEQLDILNKKKSAIEEIAAKAENLPTPFQKMALKARDALAEILGINNEISRLQNWLKAVTGTTGANYQSSYKDAEKNYKNAQKAVASIKKDSKATVDEYNKAIAAEKKAKEDFEKLGGQTKDTSKAEESAAEKTRKKLEELSKAKEKQSLQDIRSAKDLEFQLATARVNAMDEGSAKVIAQMNLDYEKEKEALKRQQEDALKTKKENARAIFEANEKNKGKSFDDSSIKLTDDERKKYADLQVKLDEAYQKDKLTLELQYMRDYIKEYGTFQEKKLAIAQEYDKRIAASANEWDRKSLENQKKAALSSVDFDAINKRIDWQGVFGNLTGMLDSQLKDLISGLKEYIKTDQFKQSSATDQKTVFDAIEKLKNVIPGGEGTLNFKEIQRQMGDLGNAINHLQIATLNEKTAYDNLAKAQNEYNKALKSNNQATIEGAKRSLAMAQTAANTSSIAYKEAESNVQNLGNGFKETATDTIDGLNLVSEGLSSFASNSLPQIFKGIQSTVTGLSKLNIGGKVGEAIGSLSKALSNGPIVAQIISAVLSILDVLKDGIGTLISNLIDTVLGAIDGILKNILSFDITKQIAGSLKTGLSNILNTLSFGGFNSLISSINGGNAKETAKTISRLTSSNEALKVSVDALKDEISGTNGSKSIQAYNEAVTAQERYSDNLRKILDAQMRYSNSHHSNAYYWDLDANSLKEVNKLLGTSLNNTWNDFSKLTADQMNKIRTHLPDVWSEMINEGKYGDRFKDDWNNYADQAGKVKKMTDDLRENIAQISFDSLRDSFLNTLMDMDSNAEDFADNFEEYLTKALLNFAVGDLLDSRIKKWYESWTDTINEQNGKLTEAQIAQQKKEWEDIVKDGIAIRDNITNSTGYTGKNDINGIKGVAASITQDSANELNGNFYALRQSVNDIRNINRQTQDYIKIQTGHISDVKEAVNSYKQVFADQLTYIKMTAENTATTVSILREIRDNGLIMKR